MDFTLFEEVQVEWDGDAFKKMKNLKTLIIRNGLFSKGPKHLPNTLRVLEWWRYPSQDLPCVFHPKKLAICKLPESCFTSQGLAALLLKKKLVYLTSLNFDTCQYLTQIPDVSCLSHLEKLSFRRCENVFTIHHSVGLLEKLKILDAARCHKLKSFPPIMLTSLEQLDLSRCVSLETFPEILGKMENITRLWLTGTPIKEFPLSFPNLTRVQLLDLSGRLSLRIRLCNAAIFIRNILMMPELAEIRVCNREGWVLPKEDEGAEKVNLTVSSNVEHLCLESCNLSEEFFPMFLPYFANVKALDLAGNNFTVIPECIKECHFLTRLYLDYCKRLQDIRWIPPNLKCFSAIGCVSFTSSCRSKLLNQELHEAGNTLFYLPVGKIPEWFECQTWGPSISFWFRNKFPVMAICLVKGLAGEGSLPTTDRIIMTINGYKEGCDFFSLETDCTLVFFPQESKFNRNLDEALLESEWKHAEIECQHFNSDPFLLKWGIHVLKQQSNMEDIQFTDPCRKRKLDDDVNNSESQDQQLLKRQRLVNMEGAETQFVQQQQRMGFLSRIWNWATSVFHFLLLQQSIIGC